MQNYNSKIIFFKFLLVVFTFYFLLFNCFGCAGIPRREGLQIYRIKGVNYFSLTSLCDLRGILLDYDTFTRTGSLTKDTHRINFMVGDTLVLVDDQPQHLRRPPDIYQGMLVVPCEFKERIIDSLFDKTAPLTKEGEIALEKIKKIVIDPGHGGEDPGAIGNSGLREKDVVLDIAKRLSVLLVSDGIEVVMTRISDQFISLENRVEVANNSAADIFLSIHANANRIKRLTGFEIYYVSPGINDSQRALSAAQNTTLDFDKSCFASDSLDLKATLWDMIYTNNCAESIGLARCICQAISSNLDLNILGIKKANFQVLKGTHMPALLIEVGFLSNSKEERMLKNGYYRQNIAEAVAQGIRDYAQNLILTEAAQQ